MARIKDSSVRDVVAAADMVEVVSTRTPLRRASGSRFTGRCPFHEEKTPSFSVNPVDKLYYCFGCGKGGDVISFVRETESLDFVGAVEWLAERFRVSDRGRGGVAARRGRAEAARAAATRCSTRRRRTSSGSSGTATQALRCASTSPERGLGEEVAKEFRLGLVAGTRARREGDASAASRSTS